MKVDHTYPNKELVLIRIAEEANLSGCMISIARSCSQRIIATDARDGHTFSMKVLYSNVHLWKVVECVTHPEPIPVSKTDEKATEEVDLIDDNAIVGEEGNPDDDNDNDDDDPDDDDPDDEDNEDRDPGE